MTLWIWDIARALVLGLLVMSVLASVYVRYRIWKTVEYVEQLQREEEHE